MCLGLFNNMIMSNKPDALLRITIQTSIHHEGHTQTWLARGESTSLNAIHRLVMTLSFYNSHLYLNSMKSATLQW